MYEKKVPSDLRYLSEVRAEEDEAPPPGSRLTRWRLKGPAGFPLSPGQSSGSAEGQREEGLRAFDLRVLAYRIWVDRPVTVGLFWSLRWFCSLVLLSFFLASCS